MTTPGALPTGLVDIGLNLTSEQFSSDRDEVLARAWEAGVAGAVLTGTTLEGSRQSLVLARQAPQRLACTAGVHPHHARSWSSGLESELAELARNAAVVAVGETGLDFNRMASPEHAQHRAFEAQLALALALGKPAFLHCRDAFDAFLPRLSEFTRAGGRALVHCFTGDVDQALALQEAGAELGITGWVADRRRGALLREAVRHIEVDCLHVETDAPYLMPHNHPASRTLRRNEPAFLPWVVQALAQARGCAPHALADSCRRNSERFFGRGFDGVPVALDQFKR